VPSPFLTSYLTDLTLIYSITQFLSHLLYALVIINTYLALSYPPSLLALPHPVMRVSFLASLGLTCRRASCMCYDSGHRAERLSLFLSCFILIFPFPFCELLRPLFLSSVVLPLSLRLELQFRFYLMLTVYFFPLLTFSIHIVSSVRSSFWCRFIREVLRMYVVRTCANARMK